MAKSLDVEFLTREERQAVALERAGELKSRISDFLEIENSIPTGRRDARTIGAYKERLLHLFGGTDADWENWHWQLRNRITRASVLGEFLVLGGGKLHDIEKVSRAFRWAISPYYAALVAAGGVDGPIWRQAVPSPRELTDDTGLVDPMSEELTSPAPAVTRRYPDRLIINVTNQCPMYCRHCQRRRNIGEIDKHQPRRVLEEALAYVRANPEIRDVLVTGGDALLMSDRKLDWLLGELHAIGHLETKRIGTRTPVTLPQRITPELCAVLEKYPPIYINTQFNHPLEVTAESAEACARLIGAGVVLGNQAVLLRGVNDDAHTMKKLNHELLRIRVRPYYMFHAKPVRGTGHFITSIDTGLDIMEHLRGQTSGMAIPTYVLNAPGGWGKIPLGPNYVLERSPRKMTLRTWENRVISYPNQRA